MSQFHLPLYLQVQREMKRWTRETRRQNARASARDCMCALAISFLRAPAEWQARVTSSEPGFVSWLKKCVAMCLASAVCGTLRRDKSPRFSPKKRRERAQIQFHCTSPFFFAPHRTRDLRCQPLNCLHFDAGLAPRLAESCRLELFPSGNLQAIALHSRELCSFALAPALAHPDCCHHIPPSKAFGSSSLTKSIRLLVDSPPFWSC